MTCAFKWHQAFLPSLLLIMLVPAARAGGPRYVAGSTYFDSSVKGTPLTWAAGNVTYYTDQGDLSSILPGPAADAFVADAFTRWTSIATAALSATRAGQLAEDVSAANVTVTATGITSPTDILPSAISFPVAIVYDADGAVTNALLGQGAGDPNACFNNAVFGGIDNFSTDAHLLHAFVVLNGNCAQTPTQLPDLKYRLVRVLGRVLGLDASQTNPNVFTRHPAPTSADYAGLALMHSVDVPNCIPISICYPDADQPQPKMDDRAALSRLYPVTTANQQNFPAKLPLADNTARIHGSVFFVDANAQPAQPMQGVNVVARWIDPTTGLPSPTYVASSISGFLFSGNAGNPATGFNDPAGIHFTQFGADDPSVEGFFDLAGLEIPNGATSAQYELSVEPLDPLWSQSVGPYAPSQVKPSGALQPIVVTVTKGADLQQDILMQGSVLQTRDWFAPTSYAAPAALPTSGDWTGSLAGYGDADYFWFSGRADRTLSVEVTALDESSTPSTSKAQPVIGMWSLDDPGTFPAPANTPSAFNSAKLAVTRLDATFHATTNFRLGIFDYRGDGRPDYQYHARVLYADTITPSRASAGGGTPLDIQGIGFRPNTAANIGATSASVLSASARELIATAPPIADGLQNITFSDPATGGSSSMSDVLTVGAGPSDAIKLLSGSNPATPIGGEAPNPIRVQVLADTATPVNGASVFLTASPPVNFSACAGATSCTVLSDETGQVSTRVTPLTSGAATISAVLAPASYANPKSVQTPLLATSSALDISVLSPSVWVAQGASADLPIKSRLLSNGKPLVAGTIAYNIVKGTGSLSATTVVTDNDGFGASILHLTLLGSNIQVSVCAQPANRPCQLFSVFPVPASVFQLSPVFGTDQAIAARQSFRPVVVRVTDSSNPANPVIAANVIFQTVVIRSVPDPPPVSVGGIIINRKPSPVILSSSKSSALSPVWMVLQHFKPRLAASQRH